MLESQDSTAHIYICCFLLVYSERPQTSHQDARKQVYLDPNTPKIGSLEQNLKFLRVQAAESVWLLTNSPHCH